jgi:protein SCO1/2
MSQFKVYFSLCVFVISLNSYTQTPLFDQQMQVGFDEKQGQYVDLGVKLVNEAGDTVLLKNVIDKPTILNLVYFQCAGTCSPLGKDYKVITVSFDPTERIKLGINKKESYISTMKKKEEAKNWQFFVSDSVNLNKLTRSVGFNYQKVNDQFVHPTGLIALAADGKIIRYLRGIEFLPFDIKITMIEAAKGKIGPSINRLLAVCYGYDSKGNQFVFNVTRVSAIVISFIVILIFLALAFSRIKTNTKVNK